MTTSPTYLLAFVFMISTSVLFFLWHCRHAWLQTLRRRQEEELALEGIPWDVEDQFTRAPAAGAPSYVIERLPVFKYVPKHGQTDRREDAEDTAEASAAATKPSTECSGMPEDASRSARKDQAGSSRGVSPTPASTNKVSNAPVPEAVAAAAAAAADNEMATRFEGRDQDHISISINQLQEVVPGEGVGPDKGESSPNEGPEHSGGLVAANTDSSSSNSNSSRHEDAARSSVTPRANVGPSSSSSSRAQEGGGGGGRDIGLSRCSSTSSVRDGDTACVICFCDYEEGEDIKELPCKHCYHAACIDPWLARHANCPLCKRAVWEPLPLLLLPLWVELLQGVALPSSFVPRVITVTRHEGSSNPGGAGAGLAAALRVDGGGTSSNALSSSSDGAGGRSGTHRPLHLLLTRRPELGGRSRSGGF